MRREDPGKRGEEKNSKKNSIQCPGLVLTQTNGGCKEEGTQE